MLVEALVALAIVAMMAGLVFETIAQLGDTAARAADRREATLLARSVMAAATLDARVPAIAAAGSDSGLNWQISTQPYSSEGGLALRKVTVTIVRPADGAVLARLDGLRTGS